MFVWYGIRFSRQQNSQELLLISRCERTERVLLQLMVYQPIAIDCGAGADGGRGAEGAGSTEAGLFCSLLRVILLVVCYSLRAARIFTYLFAVRQNITPVRDLQAETASPCFWCIPIKPDKLKTN